MFGVARTVYGVAKTVVQPSTFIDNADNLLFGITHANEPTWKTGLEYAGHRARREWGQVDASLESLKRTLRNL